MNTAEKLSELLAGPASNSDPRQYLNCSDNQLLSSFVDPSTSLPHACQLDMTIAPKICLKGILSASVIIKHILGAIIISS